MSAAAETWKEALIRAGFAGLLEVEEPLAPRTTWRIGGPAELLATPSGRSDLVTVVDHCHRNDLPWRVLGNGSNLLVRDEGVRGVVVRIRRGLERVSLSGETVHAEAGALFPTLANQTAGAGLAGLEFGAGSVETLDRQACAFRYRGSALRDHPDRIVLGARLRLVTDDPARIRERLERFAASRKANQPTSQPSCGSVFVQPPGDYAGRLIDAAGLKGLRVGAIEVSPLHANFFVNHGGGTAHDVLALVDRVETEVERRFGVRLEREFELW
jgi:UDP-N-acetylmuramate dehydrogenase